MAARSGVSVWWAGDVDGTAPGASMCLVLSLPFSALALGSVCAHPCRYVLLKLPDSVCWRKDTVPKAGAVSALPPGAVCPCLHAFVSYKACSHTEGQVTRNLKLPHPCVFRWLSLYRLLCHIPPPCGMKGPCPFFSGLAAVSLLPTSPLQPNLCRKAGLGRGPGCPCPTSRTLLPFPACLLFGSVFHLVIWPGTVPIQLH